MEVVLLLAGGLVAVGAIVLGVSLFLGWSARRRFETHVDACYARLGNAQKQLANVEARAGAYPRDLPAPFALVREDLDMALVRAGSAAAEAHLRRRSLLHGAGQPVALAHLPDARVPGGRFPIALLAATWLDEPRRWRRLDAKAAAVESALADLEVGVQAATAVLEGLEAVPQEVAAACSSLERMGRQAVAHADELAGQGAQGTALDLAGIVAHDLVDRLAAACTATPRDTVAAHELVELLSVPVAEVHAQLCAWRDDARRLDEALADARCAVDDAGKRVGALPPAIDGTELIHRLEGARDTRQALEQEALCPDVRALSDITLRARDVVELAGTLADDADGAAQRQIEFAAHYRRADTALARAALEMQAAAAESIYPLDWREWTGRCSAAQRSLALMGDPAAPRTPYALEVDGALAERLAAQATRLIDAVGQARAQREALRRLLQQPALVPDRPWEARAATLHDAANCYAPENWPAADRVPYLRDDVAELAALHAQWVPREPWLRLRVDTLDRQLDAVARLAEALHALEPALVRTEEALVALHTAEADAVEAVAGCGHDLRRLVDSVHGARPAYDRPVTRHLGLLRQLAQQGEALEAAFARRDRGTVAGKIKRADRWARVVQGRLKPVCRDLEAAAGATRTALAEELAATTAMLSLDAEPAVRSAAACAATPRPRRRRLRGDRLSRAAGTMADALALAADRRATWQALDELAMATRGLVEPLQGWRAVRDEAQAAWDRLEGSCQALAAGWPPVKCDSGRVGRLRDVARRARDEARREEERHLASARRVPEAITCLHSLAEAYRRAAAAATEAEIAARQAHARVRAAADALEAARIHNRNPDVDAEIERLKRQWSRRPPSEDEAMGEIERLRRRLSAG